MSAHRGLACTAVAVLSFSACAPALSGPGAAMADGGGEARWVETSQRDVRTLLVAPAHVARLAPPEGGSADLAVGGFFARYETDPMPLDQLALVIIVDGREPGSLFRSGLELMLEIDGEYFLGAPGVTSNSVRYDPRDGGRTTIAIPISLECLRRLASAERVRGRLGAWGDFTLSDRELGRLRSLLDGIPADVKRRDLGGGLRTKIAAMQ